jgi:dephospho-CoA kinase
LLSVGLTGNVAAGKSTVAGLFRQWGAVVVDADALARAAVDRGTPALAAIARRFGREVLQTDGALDRAALRRRVMASASERAALNAIVHPEVARLREVEIAKARAAGAPIVVHDIPLLFEVLDPADFDVIVLVDAPEGVRRARLMQGRGLGATEADALIGAQLSSAAKQARSHIVITNDGSREALEAAAHTVWTELQARAGVG